MPQTANPAGSRDGTTRVGAGELFRQHARYVASFFHRLGVPLSMIDDCVQDVFMVVHRRGGFVEETAKASTYLSAIAIRVWSDRRRHAQLRAHDELDESVFAAAAALFDPERATETTEQLILVQRALDRLDEDHRVAFVLFELEGHSGPAISEMLGIPEGTVHSRLHAARQEFLRLFGRPWPKSERERESQ